MSQIEVNLIYFMEKILKIHKKNFLPLKIDVELLNLKKNSYL